MSNKVRNVTKQLLGAEDVAFGRGIVNQTRGGAVVPVHRLDLELPVVDEAELATTDTAKYPRASIGSRSFVAVNGQYQELSHILPVLYRVGGMISAEYPYCINDDVIAKWTGAFPKTLTVEDADFSGAGWQIYTVGSSRTIVSETQPPLSYGKQGFRWYNPTVPATYIYYNDGDSGQWVEEASQGVDGALRNDLANVNSTVQVASIKALDLGRKYGEFVLVEDYADLVAAGDWTAAWNAALATGKNVAGTRGVEYKVTGKLFNTNNQYVDLRGSAIRQYTDQTPIFDATNKVGVTITGGKLFGKAEASYVNSSSSLAIGVLGTGATNLKVYDMEFDGFYYSPLMVASGGTNIYYFDNIVDGIPAVLAADTSRRNTTGATIIGSRIFVNRNDIRGTASGLIIGQGSSSVFVEGNTIHDLVNEHGIYADTGIVRLSITNNIIYNTGTFGTGLKVQYYDAYGVAPQYTKIEGNTIINTGTDGILVYNSAGTLRVAVVNVSDNIVVNAGAYGINVRDSDDAIVSGNNIVNCGQSGIAYGRCGNIDIIGNKVRGSGTSGIRDLSGVSSGVTIALNKIYNPATSNTAGDRFGILIALASTDVDIKGNKIVDTASKCEYGIYVQPDINATLSLTDNDTLGLSSTGIGIRLGATGVMKEYRGNKWGGSIPSFNGPALPSVASSAAIYIPQAYDVFKVTGTTNISTIEATGNANRRITMIFTDTLTVALSGNIKISAGAFSAVADKTLTLVCDGTFWYG